MCIVLVEVHETCLFFFFIIVIHGFVPFPNRSDLQKSGLDDGHLLEILRAKDGQIVELEIQSRDQQKVIDLQENQLGKLKEEIRTYQTMLEVTEATSYFLLLPSSPSPPQRRKEIASRVTNLGEKLHQGRTLQERNRTAIPQPFFSPPSLYPCGSSEESGVKKGGGGRKLFFFYPIPPPPLWNGISSLSCLLLKFPPPSLLLFSLILIFA